MAENVIELRPIKETPSDYDQIEENLRDIFRRQIYLPLLKAMQQPSEKLENAYDALKTALHSGRLTYYRGTFSGQLSATTSKQLRGLGAKFDRAGGTYKIPFAQLPSEVKAMVQSSEANFQVKLGKIDTVLSHIVPEEVAARVSVSKSFDRALWKVNKDFKASVEGITIAPELTAERRKRIAEEWQGNMKLWVQDFTQKEIKRLRRDVQKAAFSGNRYGAAVKTIQKSYGVSMNKAKFLARQETGLLMSKFKEVRYQEAGIDDYIWGCVAGTPAHPVRPAHKALEGKTFKFSAPPVTTAPGEPQRRNNPGEDFGCRCFARPVVRFATKR